MSTATHTPPTATRSKRAITTAITALGVIVAVAVTALALTLPGSSRPTTVVHHPAAVYYPLIHFRGDGAPPAAVRQTSATGGQATPTTGNNPRGSAILSPSAATTDGQVSAAHANSPAFTVPLGEPAK